MTALRNGQLYHITHSSSLYTTLLSSQCYSYLLEWSRAIDERS